MRTVLFAAILLTVASVPAAYASTLQLVTENGNVFSIDFDEILFLWEMQNPSNQTQAIAILQQQIANLTAGIIPITNSTEIDDLQVRINELQEQLNSNSTSTEAAITLLESQIEVLRDELHAVQTNSTLTDEEIAELNKVLELSLDLLIDSLDELENEEQDGIGAGALGSSGRLVTIPVQGILTSGNHTSYTTSGKFSPSTLFHHSPNPIGWAALIQDDDVYDEYHLPDFGAAYVFDSANQSFNKVIAGSSVLVTGYKTLNGTSLVTFDSDGMAVSGSGDILIGIGSASLGTGKSLDVDVPAGSSIRVVSSPNDLLQKPYVNGKFQLQSVIARYTTTHDLIFEGRLYTGSSGTDTDTVKYREYPNSNSPRVSLYSEHKTALFASFNVFVSDVDTSWRTSTVQAYAQSGYCENNHRGGTHSCSTISTYHPRPTPDFTYRDMGDGLYHITGIRSATTEETPVRTYLHLPYTSVVRATPTFIQHSAAHGTWHITDSEPWVHVDTVTTNQSYQLTPKTYDTLTNRIFDR